MKDLNGDQLVQPDEVDFTEFVAPGGGFNPAAPTSVRSANVIDPDLDAPITQSLVFGVDRQLAGSLAIQVNYSWTRTHNYMGSGVYNPWVGLTANDYNTGALLTGTLPNGQTFSVQTYTPIAALVAANGNSRILTNWDGYSSRYNGIEVSLVKRLSNRWMVRIGGSINAANATTIRIRRGTTSATRRRSTPSRSRTAARSSSAAPRAAPATTSSTVNGS